MKKVPIILRIGLLVPVLLVVPAAFADVAADLKQAEGLYQAGQYTQAEQAYLTVIKEADPNKPADVEAAFNARKKLASVYIATDRLPQVQAAVQELLARHSGYEWLPHALHEVVEQARDFNKTTQAGQVYRDILNAQPAQSSAVWLKMGTTIADVYLANGPAVEAGVKDITTHYSTEPWSGEALAQIGWAYDKLGRYEKARPLYEYVVDNWPDKPRVIYAHTALVRGCIRLRDKQAAQTRLGQLVERYAKDIRLPRVLNEIARGYREAQMYQEARPISQYILDNYSGDEQCLWADRDILMCDIRTGAKEAAQARFQRLVGTYGESGYLPYVLNEISGEYRQVQMYGQARAASQCVLDNFAGSDQCLWAQRDVVLSSLALNDPETATAGTQNLLTRYANQSGAMWAISEVAEAFSKANQHEQARNLFRFNLTNSPASNDTIWSLRGFINESIALKDDASTDTGIKKLFSEYAVSKNLPMAAVHIGRQLCAAGRARASELFQYVLDKYPDHEQALFAKVGMGHVYLLQGEDNQAEDSYQKILTDYRNRPDLAEAVQLMGESYYGQSFRVGGGEAGATLTEDTKAYIQKAIAKWNLILEQMPEVADVTPVACYGVARGYYQLGEAQAALHYSQQFLDRWPDHIDARRAHIITFKACKQLLRDGTVTRDQVAPLMQRAVAVVKSSTLVPPSQQLQGSAVQGDGQGTGGAK